MADTRVFSNGYLNVWLVPINGIANPAAPTAAEINAGVNVSAAVSWDGTTFPTMAESTDLDDRSILDEGNATSRGFAQYEAELSFFRPAKGTSPLSPLAKAYNLLKNSYGNDFYVVTRVLQNTKGQASPAVAGQFVSVFKMKADKFVDSLDGEDSYKFVISWLPQGLAHPNTLVKLTSGAITVVNASGSTSLTVGGHAVLRASLGGHRATQLVTWTSSDPTKASVSPNGVVTAIAAGTAQITASHPSASAASTAVSITVA